MFVVALFVLFIVTNVLCEVTPKQRLGPNGYFRIVDPQEYAYTVEITTTDSEWSGLAISTGLLLSRSVVLTAGHVFFDEYGRLVRQHARVKFRAANTNGDVEFVVRSSGPIYGKRVIPPDDASC
ncbi:hypothetical protein Tcan_12192 [Toxocara canis]|uniref:Peptidase S1 domain-containing protein n=1 Tax=Toxocara canis TaxID=6265 RepID=A0A0B2UTZ8_TOXCA|nr:hypothetical protein Tcan_12192 [Toxocara canis]